MNTKQLSNTANTLAADDKGLLAMDESNPARRGGYSKAIESTVVELVGGER